MLSLFTVTKSLIQLLFSNHLIYIGLWWSLWLTDGNRRYTLVIIDLYYCYHYIYIYKEYIYILYYIEYRGV